MARAFVFALEAALQQRVRQEQAAQLALAQTVAAGRTAAARLAALEQEVAALRRAPATATFDPQVQMTALYYIDRCTRAVAQQRQIVIQWDAEIERARLSVVAASQRRQALDRLRERQQAEFTLEGQRRADAELDELVVTTRRTRGHHHAR